MKKAIQRMIDAFYVPVIFIVVIWGIFFIETLFGIHWQAGIMPRNTAGLLGIVTSPLLHGGFRHILSNTIPFLVLGWCLFYFYRRISWKVFVLLWLFSGILTWCIGRTAWHIGASGLIYALASYLFFSGFFSKYIPLLLLSLVIAFMYGGLVWGLFPTASYISWEGHLAGAVAGYGVAWLFHKEKIQKP